MKETYTESSVRHFLIKTHLLLDQAVALGMIAQNPAREVRLRRDLNLRMRPSKERRILNEEEIGRLLKSCSKYPQYLNSGLPTVVYLGLYAGLRNEEVCWLKWTSVDWDKRILNIQESVCELTGESWVPKDYETRRVDVKPACMDYLEKERQRQEREEVLGPFVLSAGRHLKQVSDERLKPMHPDSPSEVAILSPGPRSPMPRSVPRWPSRPRSGDSSSGAESPAHAEASTCLSRWSTGRQAARRPVGSSMT